jgi:type I restriction enzyme S subunit
MSIVANEAKELRDFVSYVKGKPPAQQTYFGTGAELYLTPEYLRGRGTAESVKASGNAVRISDGDTVVLWDGSNAGEIFRGRKGVLASTMSWIMQDDSFDRDYFYFALKHWEPYLKGQTSGSGIPHVDKEVLGKLVVQEFQRPEQTKIAEILSTIDQAILQTEALIAKQEHIKAGLMQDLLMRGIDEKGNLRCDGHQGFKNSPLGRIPAEWGIQELTQCADRLVVGLASSTTHAYRDTGVPLIRNQNIRHGYFDARELLFLDPDFASHFPNKATRINDVLTVRTGANVGDTAMLPDDLVGTLTFTTLITSTILSKLHPAYLVWYIQSPLGQSELNRILVGGGKENLNVGEFVHFRIILPPLKEQDFAVQCLDRIRGRIIAENASLTKCRKLKAALIQDLLTGKKRVTPLLG